MNSFFLVLSVAITIVFIVGPVWLTLSIIVRYHTVERLVMGYSAMLRGLMAHLERRQPPDLPKPTGGATLSEANRRNDLPPDDLPEESWIGRLTGFLRRRAAPRHWLNDLKIHDEIEDYLTIIRDGHSERERYIRLQRKNLTMRQTITEDIEFCRTYTEALPYMGILGTVLGFFFSSTIFMPSDTPVTSGIPVSGMVLALSSTAVALMCILVVKLAYENRIIPKYIEFEQSLQVIDEYARRYGDIEGAMVREAGRDPIAP